jgi:hypothetical protein
MNLRYLLALALPLGMAACTGTVTGSDKTTDTNPGDDDDDNGTDTVTGDDDDDNGNPDSGGGTNPNVDFLATYMLIQGDMGFDATINSIVEVNTQGVAIPPAMYIFFGTEAWFASGFDFALDTEYCAIIMPLTSSAFAPWASADPTVWYGVDYTDGIGGIVTDCDTPGKDIPDGLLGPDVVDTVFNGYGGWGMGVGEWGPTFYDTVYGPTGSNYDFLLTNCVGARFYSAGSSYGPWVEPSDFYAFPVSIDPTTYEAQDDGTYLIGVPPADVYTGIGIASAWYRVFGFYYYSFNYP